VACGFDHLQAPIVDPLGTPWPADTRLTAPSAVRVTYATGRWSAGHSTSATQPGKRRE
jgi:hypothetical protein